MPKLKWSGDIRKVAKEYADDIGPAGLDYKTGSNGDEFLQRIQSHGQIDMACSQSIIFEKENAIDILMDMLICDGEKQRIHRDNLFNNFNNFVGLYQCAHKKKGFVTVIVYVGWFTKPGEESLLQKRMQEFLSTPIPPPPIEEENRDFVESIQAKP